MKVLVYESIGIWLAARRLNKGRFIWSDSMTAIATPLCPEQLQALCSACLGNASALTGVGAQLFLKLPGPFVHHARTDPLRALRLRRSRLPQLRPHRVLGQTRSPCDLPQRQLLAEIHPSDLGQHAHRDHPCIPCSKIEQDIQSRGSNFDANHPAKWVNSARALTSVTPLAPAGLAQPATRDAPCPHCGHPKLDGSEDALRKSICPRLLPERLR
ncbi:transposase [Ralstonia pickettii]|jgi:hypothetical protein|nr:hypothetical protein [Ralstonia pickettii]MBB0036791.1 hypothetical protein [Ralstonia pickettii]MBB0099178.1 hypothetical protein [Ralstonia pickettii]MBB0109126.1 hypothetical protein [Ralstonia pickettii]MBB0130105.1 hypothetical protein [Ralstonia pickettii]